MSVIEMENLTHVYAAGTPFEITALDRVSLEIQKGSFYALVGATGSGKSTLVQHFNGILPPSDGRLQVCGMDAFQKDSRRELWRKVGLVFQQPEHQLFEETVFDDVAFGPKNLGLTDTALRERVTDALQLVGLDPDEVGGLSPFRLSGGLCRKVAIAGVLALHSEVLVLDEPAAGLDPVSRAQLMERINRLRLERGTTVVLVTHSMEEAARWADRVAVLHKGRLAMEGTPRQIFKRAQDLRALDLGVPVTVELMLSLQAQGRKVNTGVLTLDETVEEIAALMESERRDEVARL